MTKRALQFFSLSAVIVLAGCVAQYTPPPSGPTAKLSLANTLYVRTAYFHNPYKCTDGTLTPFRRTIFSNDKPAVVIIPANRLITLRSYSYDYNTFSCPDVVYSFVPHANQRYLVSYKGARCRFRLTNLSTGKAVSFTTRKYRSSVFGKSMCVDALAKR